jgi:hypothetical protein
MTPEDRFLGYVQPVPWCGCWIWDGGRNFRIGGHRAPVFSPHKASYILFVGDPDELVPVRECGTDGCVNPEHHFLADVSVAHSMKMQSTNQRFTADQRRANAVKAGTKSIGNLTPEQLEAKMRAMRTAYDAKHTGVTT